MMVTGQHNIQVVGQWHNDTTAGVMVWCDTCEQILIEDDDALAPEQIAQAVSEHREGL